jgi:hypothetical protein
MQRIFIRFEANTTCFIRLFRIANKRILHAKLIKTEVNILFLANILFFSLQSEYFDAKFSEYFQKEPNIN